eukprot:m.186497 g.186497  ORF g.186497 m.186497 type:complete len:354 (+) comp16700_c0_seq7:106-1167(+)
MEGRDGRKGRWGGKTGAKADGSDQWREKGLWRRHVDVLCTRSGAHACARDHTIHACACSRSFACVLIIDCSAVLLFRRVYPREFYARFLAESIRPDGRPRDQSRSCALAAGTVTSAQGSCLVTLGKTSVICGIKAEFADPPLDNDNIGWLVPNVILAPLCSDRFKPGPPPAEAQRLTKYLKDLLCSGTVLDKGDLCIIPGKLSWVLYLDVQCLNYDGNVVDAVVLAAMGALRNVQLPKVLLPEDLSDLEGLPEVDYSASQPLNLKRTITSCTLVYLDDILEDPCLEEEDLCSSSVTIAFDNFGNICSLCSPAPHLKTPQLESPAGFNKTQLEKCIELAELRCKQLRGELAKTS